MKSFTNGISCTILKEINRSSEKVGVVGVLFFELKRHNVHYIYYLATDNIHIVLENDNTVLIKGLKKVINVKFSRNTHLIETSYDKVEIKRNHISAIQGKSC